MVDRNFLASVFICRNRIAAAFPGLGALGTERNSTPGSEQKAGGFTAKDYALRGAAWCVSDLLTAIHYERGRREGFTDYYTLCGPVAEEKTSFPSPEAAALNIKSAAKGLGVDLIGIAPLDSR